MKTSNGSKVLIKITENKIFWQCNVCSLTGSARVNNWNSPRARTCCGGRFHKNRDRMLILWNDLKSRCLDKNHPAYYRYKKFGTPGWNSFEEFSLWAEKNGWRYGLELDRINNELGYFPDNCRFVTRKENLRNKSTNRLIFAFGQTKTLIEWQEDDRSVVEAQTIAARIDRYGWLAEDAISRSKYAGR